MDLSEALDEGRKIFRTNVEDADWHWEQRLFEFVEKGGLEALYEAAWKYEDLSS